LELLQSFVNDFLSPLGGDPHVGLFLFTWLFSVVNPLSPPEEFFTLLTGACITVGILHPFWGALSVLTAIIFTDICQYWLGRGVLKLFSGTRIGNRFIQSQGFRDARRKMAEKGIWAIALCRFFFGTRAVTYVASGFLRFSFVKFVVVDGLAVLLQGTLFVVLGALFSEQITAIIEAMHEFGIWSLIALLALIAAIFLIKYLRARARRRAVACREPGEG
jgi:membrane protein DedA with SNARE-associated domain